jgi:O-antigen ligase
MVASNISLKKKLSIIFAGLIVVLFAALLVLKFYSAQSLERLLNSNDSRLALWDVALTVFKDHPFIGGGMAAASVVTRTVLGNDSHNVFIDILCNSGILGSIFFLLYFFNSSLKTLKINRSFIFSMAIVFLMPLFFINGFNTASFYLPLILMSQFSKYCRMQGASYLDFLIKE